ncbi:retinoid-inducible serine carboxypeptidase-like [Pectinophora gossypiella]|uniref:retinoid-inducible serine carboxypeptidase-like n=1 Tax=Pectinophora gossypiella TaxID=13191 RepID=UPI00214F07CE|nr:retinoid-inducible serine carboxypeptidase-like [Pectinophora gossypiella]
MKKSVIITISVIVGLVVAAGLGVLIWWLVAGRHPNFTTVLLEGEGFRDVQQTAAWTRIRGTGDMFWWFYPATAGAQAARPLILWLDGVTGLSPSLLANFGMIGPLDFNLNARNGSWVEDCNVLFVDAPLGTGFSRANGNNDLPQNIDDNTDHLLYTLESFYSAREDYQDSPLYIFGQGDGAPLALALAIRLAKGVSFSHNLKGVVIGNGVVSPALALTELGFYLDEMGYVDPAGRVIVEAFSEELSALVDGGQFEEAFDKFLTLGDFLNEEAGTVAVNLNYIIQKLTRTSTAARDYFGQREYLRSALQTDIDFNQFMAQTIAPALGISSPFYDESREAVIRAFRETYMQPTTELVEYLLNNTEVSVTIYNGNLDAVSTTPGQLKWVNNLQWAGQAEFRNTNRRTLIVNSLVEGYFRETDRLAFYWMNAAGISVPLDSPTAMRRVMQRITGVNP